MKLHATTLTLIVGFAAFMAVPNTSHAATIVPSATGFDITVGYGDLFSGPIALPALTISPLGLDIKIFNDSTVALTSSALTFTVGPISPPPLALSVSSPDHPFDFAVPGAPPAGPGLFDLAAAGPGTYTGTIAPVAGIPDGAGTPPGGTPDATYLFLYAPSPIGGPPTATLTAVSLTVVPEPGSALLALVGVLGLLVRRRR